MKNVHWVTFGTELDGLSINVFFHDMDNNNRGARIENRIEVRMEFGCWVMGHVVGAGSSKRQRVLCAVIGQTEKDVLQRTKVWFNVCYAMKK